MPAKKTKKKAVKRKSVKKRTAKRTVKKTIKKAKTAVKKEINVLEKRAMSDLKIAKAKMKKAEGDVRKYAKTHPERAALIAAGLGAAIGTAGRATSCSHN